MKKTILAKYRKTLSTLVAASFAACQLAGCAAMTPSAGPETVTRTMESGTQLQADAPQQANDRPAPEKDSPPDRSRRDRPASPFGGPGASPAGKLMTKQANEPAPAGGRSDDSGPVKVNRKNAGPAGDTGPTPLNRKNGGSDNSGLVFNFDNAPLSDVVRTLAELLNINYLLVAEPGGNVTIQTSGSLSRKDLFPLFYQILEANGLTAVREDNLYKIVSFKEAPRFQTSIRADASQPIPPAERGAQIQIIPLNHISTEEMAKILTPFISAEGSIITHDTSKTLLLVDQRANIEKALRLVETFDINLFDKMHYRFFELQHTALDDISQPLNQIVGLYTKDGAEEVEIVPLEKLNSLLVFTPNEKLFARIEEFIARLDIPTANSTPRIYIYFLKNSQSTDMVELLNSIFAEKKEEEETETITDEKLAEGKTAGGRGNPFALKPEESETETKVSVVQKTPLADFGSGTLRGEIKITEDPIRNALVIEAIPSDYEIVTKVLERLDILPRQVLISVTIAEVKLTDGLDLGVEWSWTKINNASQDTPSFWSAATGADGLFYAIGQSDKWNATLSALAQKSLVNIVSSPSVLASDNKAAQINIATEVPVASSQIQYDNVTSDKTQTDIQYRNTGVILDVTPHINEFGLVSMDINQEVSEAAGNVSVGGTSYPSFFKRSVSTSLTVNDGQTIVIGGLISKTKSDDSNGVPFLSDLPLIGWLFGTVADDLSKTELIILITPRVVANLEDVDAVTSEFSRKVGYDLNAQRM